MRRLLVNDALSQLGERTFWHDLREWFDCETVEAPFDALAGVADVAAEGATLIIRNASYFGPLKASERVPTISLLQDIMTEGDGRNMQLAVIRSSRIAVANSAFTENTYPWPETGKFRVIPLPVDFSMFEPGNPMGLQQVLGLPDGCVCWIGACRDAAGHVKGWDVFARIARLNPDLHFVAVLKDAMPDSVPPNVRAYVRLPQADLARVIGACRVGLCTSRVESQHLAGIEMGACGLPLVAPTVGTYWKREEMPGILVLDPTVEYYTAAIRATLRTHYLPETIRGYWCGEFDRSVIKAAWTKLIEEVERAAS